MGRKKRQSKESESSANVAVLKTTPSSSERYSKYFTKNSTEEKLQEDTEEPATKVARISNKSKNLGHIERTSEKSKVCVNSTESGEETDETSSYIEEIDAIEKTTDSNRFSREFYDKPCEELAKLLLGKTLVRIRDNGERLKAKIVETEAYLGGDDKAAHSFGGKKTKRNTAMFMDPGTAYVYHIYGMYTCMNISSRGEGAAVLLRACEPIEGKQTMKKLRSVKKSESSKPLKDKQISSGPSKLTQALSIDKQSVDQKDLTTEERVWVEPGVSIATNEIVSSNRIGVDYAGEWAKKKLRFYVLGSEHVSVRDKLAETQLQ